MGVGGLWHMLATLPPEVTRYQLYWRLHRPQDWSGQVGKISPARGFVPRSVQPIANCCTGYAVLVHT
jgi:hypothetical protein